MPVWGSNGCSGRMTVNPALRMARAIRRWFSGLSRSRRGTGRRRAREGRTWPACLSSCRVVYGGGDRGRVRCRPAGHMPHGRQGPDQSDDIVLAVGHRAGAGLGAVAGLEPDAPDRRSDPAAISPPKEVPPLSLTPRGSVDREEKLAGDARLPQDFFQGSGDFVVRGPGFRHCHPSIPPIEGTGADRRLRRVARTGEATPRRSLVAIQCFRGRPRARASRRIRRRLKFTKSIGLKKFGGLHPPCWDRL